MFNTNHYHRHNHDSRTTFPGNINVNEYRAATDESIKIFNEMQEKAFQNIIAKVDVKDNLVEGTIIAFDRSMTSAIDFGIKVLCRFKINGQEFIVEHKIDPYNRTQEIEILQRELGDYLKSVMVWFALKKFSEVAFKQIMGTDMLPQYSNLYLNQK